MRHSDRTAAGGVEGGGMTVVEIGQGERGQTNERREKGEAV